MADRPKNRSTIPTKERVRSMAIGLLILTVAAVVVVFPSYINRGIDAVRNRTNIGIPKLPESGFNLGLDLQGGAHLLFEADTSKVVGESPADAVEGVRDIIERRVRGGLGVTEPLVQTTKVGDRYRVIVELPGVTDVNQAIKLIGETPVLEFKEQNNEPQRQLTSEEQKKLNEFNSAQEKKANEALAALRRSNDFAATVRQYSEDDKSKTTNGDLGFITQETSPEMYAWAAKSANGAITPKPLKLANGYAIVKRVADREGELFVSAAHLLICYKGAQGCTNETYNKEQALAKINEIKQTATPANFTKLAGQYSTEPNATQTGGDLGSFKRGTMVQAFEDAVFGAQSNSIIGPIETPFGYHLIWKKSEEKKKEFQVSVVILKTKSAADILPPQEQWKNSGLSGAQLSHAEVTTDNRTGQVQVSLQFNAEGTQLFADITKRNVDKQVAIFLDGEAISIPRVSEPILGGQAVINGNFSLSEARILAQRLNSGALPVPIQVISQEHVDATLGADSLAKSFKAGLAGLILVMLFMALYYRLPGIFSVVSLLAYTIYNAAIFKLFGVTLTLSGIAGFILSIGMAVDANVLVFERLKEELRAGKSLSAATEESFQRAWPSIRDGHVTTLISCFFLMWFGSGFVKGFATVLAVGTLMSLFTAITVTRTMLRLIIRLFKAGSPLFLGYKKQ